MSIPKLYCYQAMFSGPFAKRNRCFLECFLSLPGGSSRLEDSMAPFP